MMTFADFYIRVSARENLGFSHAKNRRFFSTVHEIEDFVAWYKDISMSFIFMN
jgi:hypothetical protein